MTSSTSSSKAISNVDWLSGMNMSRSLHVDEVTLIVNIAASVRFFHHVADVGRHVKPVPLPQGTRVFTLVCNDRCTIEGALGDGVSADISGVYGL